MGLQEGSDRSCRATLPCRRKKKPTVSTGRYPYFKVRRIVTFVYEETILDRHVIYCHGHFRLFSNSSHNRYCLLHGGHECYDVIDLQRRYSYQRESCKRRRAFCEHRLHFSEFSLKSCMDFLEHSTEILV